MLINLDNIRLNLSRDRKASFGKRHFAALDIDHLPEKLIAFVNRLNDRGFLIAHSSVYIEHIDHGYSFFRIAGKMVFRSENRLIIVASLFGTDNDSPDNALEDVFRNFRMSLHVHPNEVISGRGSRKKAMSLASGAVRTCGIDLASEMGRIIVEISKDRCEDFDAYDIASSLDNKGTIRRGYECRQCGHCCTSLSDAFCCDAEPADLRRWETERRWDILGRVGQMLTIDEEVRSYLWVKPSTGEDVTRRCPWLRKLPGKNKYVCRIHDTKPAHCRRYPRNRKHAVNWGCPGYDEKKP